ncbi:MAG: hypothetical protein ACOCRK_01120 [bacterium]
MHYEDKITELELSKEKELSKLKTELKDVTTKYEYTKKELDSINKAIDEDQ